MYPETENIKNSKSSGLVRCLHCKKQFDQIFTECPICKFDSTGRAECLFCHKVINQFAFIQNSNRCPHCNSEKHTHPVVVERGIDTDEVKTTGLHGTTQKNENIFSNIVILIVGFTFIIISYFLTEGFEYFSESCYIVLAFGIIIFIAGIVRFKNKRK